ncbi:MAG: response regulator transcription factor [Chloroflexi bacterium]|nr:response regulator transcription factor [Chloroflexota bacterium]MBV9599761.1 response regulator transcription factor [Chloroflexota bacterium]
MVRVLVVDDEAEVRDALRRGLELLDFDIQTAVNGVEGVAGVESWQPDLVLLDLAMPVMSGLTALKQIRGWSQVPIIVLSVMGEEADKVRALEAGADDYMTKPFGMQELQARIRVVLRRTKEGQIAAVLQFGDVQLDIERRVVSVHDAPIHLSPIEYEIFKLLALAPGRVLTYRSLLTRVWGPNYGSEVHYLRPVMTALRKKLGNRLIRTEPGVGYRLEDPRA